MVETEDLVEAAKKKQLLTTPANDLEAERSLLGAILMDASALDLVASIVTREDFYRVAHGQLFHLLEEMRAERQPIGADTLVLELRARGLLETIGGAVEIVTLSNVVSTPANAGFYAERIRQVSRLRKARIAVAESLVYLTESREPPDEQLALVQNKVFEATRAIERRSSRNLASLFAEAFDRLNKRKTGQLQGVLSGFPGIDALTRGMQPGEVTVVAARPSVGKSAFALNVARNVVKEGTPVAFFSVEMEGVSLAENFLASLAHVNTLHLRRATLSASEERLLLDMGEYAESWPLEIDDERPVSLRVLRSKAIRLKAEGKLGLLVVDYLQLMEADQRGRSRAEEVAEISRGLKVLARDLEVPIMALAQLNREGEKNNRRPKASDLRESGSIEADADALLLLHPVYVCSKSEEQLRHEYRDAQLEWRGFVDAQAQDEANAKKVNRTNALDVHVAKARLGEQGHVALWFDKAECLLRGQGEEA